MKTTRVYFAVRGTHPFPIDMMRYDECIPGNESNSYAIERTFDDRTGPRTIIVCRPAAPAASWQPTRGRWQSFGWTVLASALNFPDCEDAAKALVTATPIK